MGRLPLAVILALLLWACGDRHREYAGFTELPAEGWAYGDTLVFYPEVADSIAVGALSVTVGHNTRYRWSNLWLEVSYPAGKGVVRDTLEMVLADDYGHWLGTGASSYLLTQALPKRHRISRGTPVAVRHVMRTDTLRDIERVGLSFDVR